MRQSYPPLNPRVEPPPPEQPEAAPHPIHLPPEFDPENGFDPERLMHALQDERTRARRREAIFLSIIVHLLIFILILINPKFLHSGRRYLLSPQQQLKQQHFTYLEMPHLHLPKPKRPVHSHVLSNRDRQLHRHVPVLNSLSAPPVRHPTPRPSPPPAPRIEAQNHPPAPPQAAPPPSGSAKTRAAKQPKSAIHLRPVPHAQTPNPLLALNGISPEEMLRRAMHAAARAHSGQGQSVAEVGRLPRPPSGNPNAGNGQVGTGVQILTNTEGVDFSSYLQRIIQEVRINWYAVMPEEAYLGRKGRSVIIFKIERNGNVPGLQLVSPSGTVSFDHAALAAISASNPFPPLPSQFHGPSITLQFSFFYNIRPQNY